MENVTRGVGIRIGSQRLPFGPEVEPQNAPTLPIRVQDPHRTTSALGGRPRRGVDCRVNFTAVAIGEAFPCRRGNCAAFTMGGCRDNLLLRTPQVGPRWTKTSQNQRRMAWCVGYRVSLDLCSMEVCNCCRRGCVVQGRTCMRLFLKRRQSGRSAT